MKNIQPQLKHAQFHLTNKCNLNCLFCWRYNEDRKKYKDMNSEILLRRLKEACDMNPKKITLSGGGEPLCKANILLEMIRWIKSHDPIIEGFLITNATLFNKEFVEEMAKVGWDNVIISLQSPNWKTNDFLMGKKGAFEKAVKSIRLINKVKKNMHRKKPTLIIRTVITRYNYKQTLEMIKLAKKLGIKNVMFRMVNEGKKINRGIKRSKYPEFINLIKKTEMYSKKLNVTPKFEFKIDDLELKNDKISKRIIPPKKKICLIPFTELIVFGNGSISVCCNYFKEQLKKNSGGVIKDNKNGLKDIWINKFQKMRKELYNKKLYPLCKICSKDAINHNEDLIKKMR